MESFYVRYKNPLVLALALLLQFALLAVQVRPHLPGAAAADQAGVKVLRLGVNTVVTPPEKVLHSSGLSLREVWSGYVDLIRVKQQNQQLQAENQRLQLEQAALAEDARQGERLQELLAFKQHYVENTIPAQVVGTSGSDRERILNLDKGSDDGIAAEMPVITPDGVVGRIRGVSAHSSQVLEISDATSAAGVLLEQTRTRGILRGDSVGHAKIVSLMPDDRIHPGQLVLTSGGDQVFPRGLPVGVVDQVVPDIDNPPLVDVILKPAANLNRLEEVLVVTGTSAAPSSGMRRDLARSEGTASALKAAAAAKAAAVAEAALEAQRASDILAQRLPSAANVDNPDAPDAAPGASPATADSAAAPLHPAVPLHPDHFSPGGVPAADSLTPGQRLAPLAAGVPPTDRPVKAADGTDAAAVPSPTISPAFRAAHEAAIAARPHPPAAASPSIPAPAAPAANGGAPVTAPGQPAAAATPTFAMKPMVRRVPVLNPDGTPQLNADGTPAVKRIPVLNPDGTPAMHRVAIVPALSAGFAAGSSATPPGAQSRATAPASAAARPSSGTLPGSTPGVTSRPVARAVPAQGAAVGASPPRARAVTPKSIPGATPSVTQGSTSAVPAALPSAPNSPGITTPPPAAQGSIPTQIVNDGPVAGARSAPRARAPVTPKGAAPRRRTPEVVPDDGSRPPAAAPASPPATAPQERP